MVTTITMTIVLTTTWYITITVVITVTTILTIMTIIINITTSTIITIIIMITTITITIVTTTTTTWYHLHHFHCGRHHYYDLDHLTITIITTFLQLSREGDSQPTDADENSQNILNLIKDTSNAAAGQHNEVERYAVITQTTTELFAFCYQT
jgi:hypothetical protein